MNTNFNVRKNLAFRNNVMPIVMAYGALIILCTIAQILKPGFLELNHLQNLIKQNAFLGLVCLGQMLVIITGGTDLSITYNITLCNVMSSQIMAQNNDNILKCLVIVLVIGIIVGLANGLGIYYLKIPAMIMTLGVGTVLQGLGYIYTQGAPKGSAAPALSSFINGKVFGLTYGSVIIWIAIAVIAVVVMRYTQFGRSVYAVGANAEAARYSGIDTCRTLCLVYVTSGVMASVAGMLLVGYSGTAYLYTGNPYNMDSIAACVVGGTLITGGQGNYIGVIAGVLLMAALNSILIMINMPEAIRKMVKGFVILIMILLVHRKKSQ